MRSGKNGKLAIQRIQKFVEEEVLRRIYRAGKRADQPRLAKPGQRRRSQVTRRHCRRIGASETLRDDLTIAEVFWRRRTTNHAGPVNAVGLFRVRRYFDEARFDHYLLGRLVDLDEQLLDVIHVRPGLAIKNRVRALIDLRSIPAGELRGDQGRGVFCPRIAKLIAVAFGRLGGPFRGGLDVINVLDLIEEQPFSFHDDRDRLQRGHVFQTHRHRASNGFAHDHVDLRLASEQSQHCANLVSLKFANAHAAVIGNAVGFYRTGRSGRRGCGGGRSRGRG